MTNSRIPSPLHSLAQQCWLFLCLALLLPMAASAAVVAPAITVQPTAQTVQDGQSATFAVTASGTAPLTYQWQVDGMAIAGASAASYTTPPTRLSASGARYSVVVGNSAGTATSAGAMLTVNSFTGARYFSLIVEAVAVTSPPSITLKWAYQVENKQFRIYRKGYSDSAWTLKTSFAATTTSLQWTDTTVSVGVPYEYRIERDLVSAKYGAGTLSDNLCGGIDLPSVDSRGTVLLLVDNTMAAPLSFELARLQDDLVADGWQVKRHDVARGPVTGGTTYTYDPAAVAAVKSVITSEYQSDPANVRSVFLFGHVPVPYSGDTAWDGHTGHKGAWACDLYYADIGGTWTDTTVNLQATVTNAQNVNVPGDGKFDQTYAPVGPKLEVGRVDLSNLPAFAPKSETDLLRQYLDKEHAQRIAKTTFLQKGIVEDYFREDYLAAMGWDAWASLFGRAQVASGTMAGDLTGTTGYAGYYLCGAGAQYACWRYTTTGWAALDPKAQFCYLFGSWFGDWDGKDDFLRAPLAGSSALASAWSIDPTYLMGRAALGGSFGEAIKLSGNVDLYHNNWTGDPAYSDFIALMGDPTLRFLAVAPPSALTITADTAHHPVLKWKASTDAAVLGYHVYRAASPTGPFVRVTTAPLTGLTYTDSAITSGTAYYQIKAAKMESTGAGRFTNLSLALSGVSAVPAGGTLAFSAATYRQAEGNSGTTNAIITITRSGGTSGAASVHYATSAGTATAGADYTETNGTLSWAAGDASAKTFSVAVVGDLAIENDETVNLSLSAASGAALGSPSAQLVIANDDAGKPGTIEFTTTSYAQVEGNSGNTNTVVTLTRLGGSYGAVSVNLVIAGSGASDGTATRADNDYAPGQITVAWANGQAGSIAVSVGPSYGVNVGIVGDTRVEPDEYLTMSLAAPTGGATLGLAQARLLILNDDGPATAPSILRQPLDQTVLLGTRAGQFSVLANGVPVPTYQWTKNGNAISGATAALYTTPAPTLADNGAVYRVVVTNSAGSVSSGPATLTVLSAIAPPIILTQPANVTVNAGQGAFFLVVPGSPNAANLSYQWRKNGVDIIGANGSGYTTPPTAIADNGAVFSVVVGNGYVTTTSVNATLTVTALAQAITGFNAFGARTYGAAPFAITGVSGGGSGKAVTFTSSNPAVATVVGGVVTIVGAGTSKIVAKQAANAYYSAAPKVTHTLTVKPKLLRVVASAASRAFGAANPTFTGTLSGMRNGDQFIATFASTATAGTVVGVYDAATPEAIIPTLIDPAGRLGNYTVTSVLGTLTITPPVSAAGVAPVAAHDDATITIRIADAVLGVIRADGSGGWAYIPAEGQAAAGGLQVVVGGAVGTGISATASVSANAVLVQCIGHEPPATTVLALNGAPIALAADGSWSGSVLVPLGTTVVTVAASTVNGTSTRTLYLTRSAGG